MPVGAFTGSFDLPLLLVIVFFLFFLALVYYLRQEDKREGYPLVSDRTERTDGRVKVAGFPSIPSPKTFILPHGEGVRHAPALEEDHDVPGEMAGNRLGMPVNREAAALGTNLGPGSWTMRRNAPDLSHDGKPVFRPLRFATAYDVMKGEPDPRGYTVLGLDRCIAGTVTDIWIDESEHTSKFLEVELAGDVFGRRGDDARAVRETGEPTEMETVGVLVTDEIVETPVGTVERIEVDEIVAPVAREHDTDGDEHGAGDWERTPAPRGTVLLPMEFAAVSQMHGTVRCGAITADQFAGVPGRKFDTVITAREENRLRGYYGGGYLWADPRRAEPLL